MTDTSLAVNGQAEKADVDELLKTKSGIRLDIGCGGHKVHPTWIGMDLQPLPGVDIVHDWNVFPWPLPDECAVQVLASHVVEHVNPANGGFLRWMDEVWRLMKPGGSFVIVVPYAGSHGFWQDPTHCNGCNETTWCYFDPEHPSGLYGFYRPKPWRIRNETLKWNPATNMDVILEKRSLD